LKLSLLVAAGIAIIVGVIGMASIKHLESALTREGNVTIPAVQTLDKIVAQTLRLRMHILNHALHMGSPEQRDIEQAITKSQEVLWEQVAAYEKLSADDQDRALLEADKAAIKALEASFGPILDASGRGDSRETETQIDAFVKVAASTKDVLDKHLSYLTERIQHSQQEAAEMTSRTRMIGSIVIVLGGVLATVLGIILVRSINGQIDEMRQTIANIAQTGDFRQRFTTQGPDELRAMAISLNSLIESIQGSLRQISESSEQVARKAHGMADSALQVADASAQQSDSASGMAAAIEQMTVSVSQIGDRATEADAHARDAGTLAGNGGEIIGQTVQDIHEIAATVSAASERLHVVGMENDKISSVVAVIREVADQTNLLALNAATEAARAGEQGRGFAVVADEVRKLAERTANSTSEISTIIEGIRNGTREAVSTMSSAVERVDAGVSRAQTANSSISQIATASHKAREMVSEISAAIREQGAASTSIAQQIERIAQMAEIGSQAAASSSRAAQELDTLANTVLHVVQRYKI
jgi:methyl-accepting chemotaxis protein